MRYRNRLAWVAAAAALGVAGGPAAAQQGSVTTGAGGRTGGLGGLGGGGLGGSGGNIDGVVIPQPVLITYPAVVKFPVTPVAAPQLQADVAGVIARSTGAIANPAGIQVAVDGHTVTLRGTVANEDEARLVVGMVRLTPGVRVVKSELQLSTPTPVPPKQ